MHTRSARAKIRQDRIMHYFIDAAYAIVKEEGFRAVTIRRAADSAGYTSATLYNYFDDIQHLIFLAAIRYLEPYYRCLPERSKWCSNAIERYLSTNECFCQFSFSDPEVYELLFFTYTDEKFDRYMRQYYELFPQKNVMDSRLPLFKFFNVGSIHKRSAIQLEDCVAEGFMAADDAAAFNEITLMVFKCLLERVKLGVATKEAATITMIRYYCQLFYAYSRPERWADLEAAFARLRAQSAESAREGYAFTVPEAVRFVREKAAGSGCRVSTRCSPSEQS
jgi:AcrR family transcriptional regulator